MDAAASYLAAILPTILVATLFYFLIRSMIEGDRRERLAQRQFEAEQDSLSGTGSRAQPPTGPPPESAGKAPVDGDGERAGNSPTEA